MPALLPTNESARLEALWRHEVLDTLPEAAFDDLAALAAVICAAPIALVVFVDDDRQWFKASVGLSVKQTPRCQSFCAHTILGGSPMVVPDAALDSRFCANPFVVGEPNVRFYAGAPVRDAEGFALGSVCVIDRVPRELSAPQLSALGFLAQQVTELLRHNTVARDRELDRLKELVGGCLRCRLPLLGEGEWLGLEEYLAGDAGAGLCERCAADES